MPLFLEHKIFWENIIDKQKRPDGNNWCQIVGERKGQVQNRINIFLFFLKINIKIFKNKKNSNFLKIQWQILPKYKYDGDISTSFFLFYFIFFGFF